LLAAKHILATRLTTRSASAFHITERRGAN